MLEGRVQHSEAAHRPDRVTDAKIVSARRVFGRGTERSDLRPEQIAGNRHGRQSMLVNEQAVVLGA
jgi:hypothetical protein